MKGDDRSTMTQPIAELYHEMETNCVIYHMLSFETSQEEAGIQKFPMVAQAGDGFLKDTLQKAADVSSYLNISSILMSSSGSRESLKPKAEISFVIPKNKLSGALVPVVRNVASKCKLNDMKEEDSKSLLLQRKSRWGVDLTLDPAVKRGRALALQTRAEQIAAQLESGQMDIDTNEATRSPSPPPIYDLSGQRTNTREGRRREQLELERREAIGDCIQLNPLYKPPSGYKPIYKEAKLYIPVKDYPGYNFIGLILGPRGNTQKRMEAETGSRIAIRGKGAVKEGKKSNVSHLQGGRRDGKDAEGAFEDLHVHITADSVEKVDAAVALVEPLLTPVDEDRNTHKRKQLRELAEMNGTMRDISKVCGICGEINHREWYCPKDKVVTFQAKVECQICRDRGHPTIDCPSKQPAQGKVLDKEYLNFLEELGDGLAGSKVGTTPGLSTRLGDEDSTLTVNHPSPKITTTHSSDSATMSHLDTSLDPNQLVDVIHRPPPSIRALNQHQYTSTPWPTSNSFGNNLQYGGHFQNESDTQLSGMLHKHPSQFTSNMTNGNYSPHRFLYASIPSTYQGPLTMEGFPNPQDVQMGSNRVPTNRSYFYENSQAGYKSQMYTMPQNNGQFRRPGQLQVFNPSAIEISNRQTNPWNQSVNSQTIQNCPMVWEYDQHRHPQILWKRRLPPQSSFPPWKMARGEGWKEEIPAMPSQCSRVAMSPCLKITQNPWEARCPWNTSGFSTDFNQPWHVTHQRPLHFNPPQPSPPIPGPGVFIWKGGPAPQSMITASSIQSEGILHPFQNPPHSGALPPWHSFPSPVLEPNKILNNAVSSQANHWSDAFPSQPLPLVTKGLQQTNDLCAPEPHPPFSSSSNVERDGSLYEAQVIFTESSEVDHDCPSILNMESQIQLLGSSQESFPSFQKSDSNEKGLDSVQHSWQGSISPVQDSKPALIITTARSPAELDTEYERLMASVGVT